MLCPHNSPASCCEGNASLVSTFVHMQIQMKHPAEAQVQGSSVGRNPALIVCSSCCLPDLKPQALLHRTRIQNGSRHVPLSLPSAARPFPSLLLWQRFPSDLPPPAWPTPSVLQLCRQAGKAGQPVREDIPSTAPRRTVLRCRPLYWGHTGCPAPSSSPGLLGSRNCVKIILISPVPHPVTGTYIRMSQKP